MLIFILKFLAAILTILWEQPTLPRSYGNANSHDKFETLTLNETHIQALKSIIASFLKKEKRKKAKVHIISFGF